MRKNQEKREKRKHKKAKKKEKRSMEAKIDQLSNAILVMQNMMTKMGYVQEDTKRTEVSNKSKGKKGKQPENDESDNSDTTIYKNVVEKELTYERVDPEISFKEKPQNRDSTSSEDKIDTSYDLMEVDIDINERFIADCAAEAERRKAARSQIDELDRQCWRRRHKRGGEKPSENVCYSR